MTKCKVLCVTDSEGRVLLVDGPMTEDKLQSKLERLRLLKPTEGQKLAIVEVVKLAKTLPWSGIPEVGQVVMDHRPWRGALLQLLEE